MIENEKVIIEIGMKSKIPMILSKHIARLRKIEIYEKYAFGENRIKDKKKRLDPDNRVSVPLAQSAIIDIVGYASKPGEITTKFYNAETEKEDLVSEKLNTINTENLEYLENSELLTDTLSFGNAFELFWIETKEDGSTSLEYKKLNPKECYAVYTDTIKPKMKEFYRIYEITENLDGKTLHKQIVEIYTNKNVLKFEKSEKTKGEFIMFDEFEHPFGRVPVVEFMNNPRKKPVYYAQIDIIDSFDSLISLTQNEVDRFNSTTMLFSQPLTPEVAEMLANNPNFIDGLQEKFPEYLEKNLSGVKDFYSEQAVRLERLFRETIKIPNFQDENFSANTSGVAMVYKLLGLEFLVSQIEIYFRRGLEERAKMILDYYAKVNLESTPQKIEITWKRNAPQNVSEILDSALKLGALGFSEVAISEFIPNSIVSEDLKSIEQNYDA